MDKDLNGTHGIKPGGSLGYNVSSSQGRYCYHPLVIESSERLISLPKVTQPLYTMVRN